MLRRTIGLVFCAGALVAAGLAIRDFLGRPNIPAVVHAARSPMIDPPAAAMARSVEGLRFPDWQRWSWKPVGGRRDILEDDRKAATVLYRRGDQQITYTIIAGTGNVDDEAATQTRQATTPTGKVELSETWGPPAGLLILKRKRNKRTIVMTGTPAGARLARTMRRLAVRGN